MLTPSSPESLWSSAEAGPGAWDLHLWPEPVVTSQPREADTQSLLTPASPDLTLVTRERGANHRAKLEAYLRDFYPAFVLYVLKTIKAVTL